MRVLADTSVWVDMFRGGRSPAVEILGELLREGLLCTHGLIRAEILSGTKSLRDYRRLEEGLSALDELSDPPGLWDRVAWTRYRLARQGIQAGVADLVVAVSASHHGALLLTLDRAFQRIRRVLPLELVETLTH